MYSCGIARPGRTRAGTGPRRAAPIALKGLDVEIARGDILDPEFLENAMRGVEVVYHLAARISLRPYPEPETERINLEGTRNVSRPCAGRSPAAGLRQQCLCFEETCRWGPH